MNPSFELAACSILIGAGTTQPSAPAPRETAPLLAAAADHSRRNEHEKADESDFKIPALLVVLSLVPTLGGIARLASLFGDAPDDARFLRAPVPILLHVSSATLYCLLGAFQLSSAFRLRWTGLHRRAGRWLVLCGLLAGAGDTRRSRPRQTPQRWLPPDPPELARWCRREPPSR